MTSKRKVDYSLYLVTGRELLPSGKDYYESLRESLIGGVTLVQVREKTCDTGEFIKIATKTKAICDEYNVPVLVNDRVDVHLAAGTDGIHVGQTDAPLDVVRRLVGPHAIVGQSVGNKEDARRAVEEGADYVGIGAVWETKSKDLKGKKSLGPDGVGEILDVLKGTGVDAVAIGGIHMPNLPQLLHASISPVKGNALSGIAVISDIVGSTQPEEAARGLRTVIDSFHRSRSISSRGIFRVEENLTVNTMLESVGTLMDVTRKETPLVNQITNNVVINDSANATLAVGASPIMATHPEDVKDLSPVIGALLVNFGTIKDKDGMLVAGRAANVNRKPIVFDPVAVGATAYRRETSKELLAHWQPTVIKGNAAEIGALAKSTEVASRGVDSAGSGFADPAAVVKKLARTRACIIIMTGVSDYISDGHIVLKVSNGHELLGVITGSGCMTGSLVAVYCASARLHHLATRQADGEPSRLVQGDMLIAALAGILVVNVAAEVAASRPDVKGPGTFRAALIDELYNLRWDEVKRKAKVEVVA